MQRELTNGTASLVSTERGGYDPVARNGALMKMSRANRLRHEY